MTKHLILGFGSAGMNAAETLRRTDEQADITIVNAEPHSFYLRLDIESLFFDKTVADLMPRPPEYWPERRIAVVQDRAEHVDPARHEVRCVSSRTLAYDKLLIAVGAKPRALNIPGANLRGVTHYHTLADALHIAEQRTNVREAVIIGAGILGLEMARAAVHFGWHVTILVRGSFVGSGTVDESGSSLVYQSLQRAGVRVLFHEEVAAFEGDNNILRQVRTKHGEILPADLAVVCAGVVPDVSFLEGSGILTDGRLIVNEKMETPVPDIYAAGDVAFVQRSAERLVSCNTWNVAGAQARAAAASMSGQTTAWRDDVLYNLDYLFDQEYAIIGAWDERHQAGRTLHEISDHKSYHALVTRDGRLESAFLLGDRSADRFIRKLIASHALVEGKLDRIFAPDARVEEFSA
jgi:NAD(P)H-nitrite reductase large subunit